MISLKAKRESWLHEKNNESKEEGGANLPSLLSNTFNLDDY